MKANVGSIDKIIRVVAGLGIIGAGFYMGSWWGAVGLVPLLTASMGFCPLYKIIGVNTCPLEKKSAS
ncbi:MAG: DUF2892 domain-containing protein [Calditrichaeota bacterium]|nr:DUF2892 domain-containing protein [Calditrichota bacterium]MCB0270217.1 DUF2892 domain-containing protein [Calditrichota bacterium]MCB0287538.1 DUF2892 domain-containing protein [Calditrichota bacterium]MCB0300222.1 DUF2892 domain-containing protein [Calditrichota bacterium]MCB9069813.1 DUF2892 domain-containing protein [Calditrichia bacterium]